ASTFVEQVALAGFCAAAGSTASTTRARHTAFFISTPNGLDSVYCLSNLCCYAARLNSVSAVQLPRSHIGTMQGSRQSAHHAIRGFFATTAGDERGFHRGRHEQIPLLGRSAGCAICPLPAPGR